MPCLKLAASTTAASGARPEFRRAPSRCGQSELDSPQGATLRNGELPRSPHSPRGRPSHAVGEFPEPSWRDCPPPALRSDLPGDEISRPLEATFSALRSPTDEDKATSWAMPTALRCFAPGITMMETTQARTGNHSRPRRSPAQRSPRGDSEGKPANASRGHRAAERPADTEPRFAPRRRNRASEVPRGSWKRPRWDSPPPGGG